MQHQGIPPCSEATSKCDEVVLQHVGLLPDVITCNALISACEKGTLPQRALQLKETMQHQGLLRDVIV